MARYIIRRLSTMLLTMLLVSVVVFAIAEIAPGNVARNILGAYATPEQERSMEKQLGLHRPVATRYVSWLLGSDWQARSLVGLPLREIVISQGTVQGFHQWWAQDPEGNLAQWLVQGEHLIKLVRQKDGSVVKVPDDASWRTGADGSHYFWGIDTANHAALWVQGQGQVEYRLEYSGWIQSSDAPIDYVPLSKGLIRGDAGISLQYKRPVSEVIGRRIQNSGALAMLAFLVAMPLGVLLGLIAGLHEGKRLDRIISLGGLITTASPDFATGIILIMVFSLGLKWLPGATVFTTSGSPLLEPQKLILPVLTASLVEIGYILRITRASVVEVMNSGYVRTAILKGIPYRQVVLRHV
ncbi:MAG TPA: ABC transporter permease, partial [Anaerolineae bacterium]|nr:ABC transporter permease [Anaerolineae bacterium]